MAYTSPRQWLDLLRRKPGARFTDLGPAGSVLEQTGDFLQRSSANPGRDWRSILAEGEQRRQQSESYGTPGSAISQVGMGGSSSGFQPTSRQESYTDILKQMPGSAARDPVDPLAGDVSQDPQSFLGKVGSFFTQPGVPELLISGGAGMSQAASQPGATALGSFGAGGQAALAQHNLMQQQQTARDRLTAGTAESQQEITARQQAIQRIGTQKGVESALLAEYVAMATTEEGYEYALGQIAPEAADAVTDTARNRDIAEMQAARARLQELIAAGVAEDAPEMVVAKQAVNDWELEMGVRELPGGDDLSTGQKEWADYVVLLKQEFGQDYEPTAADMMNFRTNALTAPGRVTRRGPGEVTADRLSSTDAMNWETRDKAMYVKRYDQLDDVMNALQYSIDNPNSPRLVGFAQGTIQSIDALRSLQPEAADAFDNVRSVVFEGLKETLGGQFAEREGERLVSAAYNPYLPPEMNIKRLKRLLNEMQMIASSRDSRARHIRNNDFSISGWVDPYGDMIEDANAVQLANLLIDPTDYELIDDPAARSAAMSEDVDRLSRAELEALFNSVFTDEDAVYTKLEEELLDLIAARH